MGMVLWLLIVTYCNEDFCNEELIYLFVMLSFYNSNLILKHELFLKNIAFFMLILLIRSQLEEFFDTL